MKITDTMRLDFLDCRISERTSLYKADNKVYSYRYLQLHLGDRTIRQAIDAEVSERAVRPWREAVVKAERFVANVYNFTPTTNGLDMRDTLKFGLELRALLSSPVAPAAEKNP